MTLPPSFRPYFKMLRLNHQSGIIVLFLFGALDVGYLNTANLFILAFGLLCWSVALFFQNDYIDSADTDKASTRERAAVQTKISQPVSVSIWIGLNLISLTILVSYDLLLPFLLLFASGIFYNLPPFRFKARFPFDLLMIGIWTLVGYAIPFLLSGQPLREVLNIPFLSLGLILLTSETIHFLSDIEPDTKAGLQNSAVVLSKNTLLRIAKISLISATFGFAVLIFKHSNWWYYPIILIIPYIGYAVGRLREAIYRPGESVAALNTAYNRGVKIGNILVAYQIVVIYLVTHTKLPELIQFLSGSLP